MFAHSLNTRHHPYTKVLVNQIEMKQRCAAMITKCKGSTCFCVYLLWINHGGDPQAVYGAIIVLKWHWLSTNPAFFLDGCLASLPLVCHLSPRSERARNITFVLSIRLRQFTRHNTPFLLQSYRLDLWHDNNSQGNHTKYRRVYAKQFPGVSKYLCIARYINVFPHQRILSFTW